MKMKFGAIVTDGRGKIGGQVASRNRSGAYLRNKVTPSNPRTVSQSQARSRLAGFSQAWRGLTEAQRAAWDAAVSQWSRTNVFGDIVNPTGKNLYTRLNVNIAIVGGTPIVLPPEPGIVTPASGLSIEASASVESLDLESDALNVDQAYIIRATTNLSPGIGFFKNRLRVIQIESGSTATSTDLSVNYLNKFGNLTEGQKIAVTVVAVNPATGQTSTAAQAVAIIAS